MYMLLGERKINVNHNILQNEVSRHTNKPLRRLEILTFTKNKPVLDFITDFLKTADGQIVLGDDAGNEGFWKINQSGFSYTESDNPTYKHWIEVTEMEKVFADHLIIDEIELIPYYYKEEFEGDRLVIEAKVKVDQHTFDSLEETHLSKDFFSVLRSGVSEQKREMEFLTGTWSEDNEQFKLWVLLSDPHDQKKDDLSKIFSPLGVQMRNIRKSSISHTTAINQIVGVLIEKNILNETDLQAMAGKTQLPLKLFTRDIDFWKDEDIDQ